MKTVTFIDAGQFRPAIMKERMDLSDGEMFDWSKFNCLLGKISGGNITNTHYFDCISPEPSVGRSGFHNFLQNHLGFQTHFLELKERVRHCPHCHEEWSEHVQKGVEGSLITNMIKSARSCDQILIVSGSSDYAEAVEEVRSAYSVKVVVVAWRGSVAPELKDAANKVHELDDDRDNLVSFQNNLNLPPTLEN